MLSVIGKHHGNRLRHFMGAGPQAGGSVKGLMCIKGVVIICGGGASRLEMGNGERKRADSCRLVPSSMPPGLEGAEYVGGACFAS